MNMIKLISQLVKFGPQVQEILKLLPLLMPYIQQIIEIFEKLRDVNDPDSPVGPVEENGRIIFGSTPTMDVEGWLRDECPVVCEELSAIKFAEIDGDQLAMRGPVIDFVTQIVQWATENAEDIPKVISLAKEIADKANEIKTLLTT